MSRRPIAYGGDVSRLGHRDADVSEHRVSEDAGRAFRFVLAGIAAIILIGIVLLITVVIVYRMAPGRHMPFGESTPTAAVHSPSP